MEKTARANTVIVIQKSNVSKYLWMGFSIVSSVKILKCSVKKHDWADFTIYSPIFTMRVCGWLSELFTWSIELFTWSMNSSLSTYICHFCKSLHFYSYYFLFILISLPFKKLTEECNYAESVSNTSSILHSDAILKTNYTAHAKIQMETKNIISGRHCNACKQQKYLFR